VKPSKTSGVATNVTKKSIELGDLLRKTKFQQARLFLREGTKYCALGLICEEYRKAVGGEWVGPFYENKVGKPAFCFKSSGGYSIELPTDNILKWAGISHEQAHRIYELNDTKMLSFEEIAEAVGR
jgi:hypothetical protein